PGRTRPAGRPSPLRRRAVQVAERWIRERQEADGSWGGIQPPWIWGIIALAALGYGLDDPTLGKAVEGWQGFMVSDGERLRRAAGRAPAAARRRALPAAPGSGAGGAGAAVGRRGREAPGGGAGAPPKPPLAAVGGANMSDNAPHPVVDATCGRPPAQPARSA